MSDIPQDTVRPTPSGVTVRRVLIGLAVVIALVWAGDRITPHLPAAEGWIREQGAWAPACYIALVCLLSLVCFPLDVLFIAAGMIFGLWWGTLYLFIATMLSQGIVFLASRHLLRDRVDRWAVRRPSMQILNRAIEKRGAHLLFLIRMAPVPASPVSYLMGASTMPFRSFLLASTGLLPVAFASMYFGYAAIHAARSAANPKHVFGVADLGLYLGVAAAITIVAVIGHTARRALRQAEQEIAAENNPHQD